MKTLLITGNGAPVPDSLRDVIARGSTSFAERRADEVTAAAPATNLDRVVFWSTGTDSSLRDLASRYARLERAKRQEIVVYVTTAPDDSVPDLSPDEVYVWPQDEDRLMMAFMTGA